ncbi:hypothetical protein REMIM1_PE00541 (plasmid) [Rhizobium etli bv. mimosae str. Mim1]|nr:hypothetical protein REMIM1_PE00541 [Rhizobium etli bv. mimosae str. Mim1]
MVTDPLTRMEAGDWRVRHKRVENVAEDKTFHFWKHDGSATYRSSGARISSTTGLVAGQARIQRSLDPKGDSEPAALKDSNHERPAANSSAYQTLVLFARLPG